MKWAPVKSREVRYVVSMLWSPPSLFMSVNLAPGSNPPFHFCNHTGQNVPNAVHVISHYIFILLYYSSF